MNCHACGSVMERQITDLPFKTGNQSIVILKGLPVLQCGNCREYIIEDSVMEKVEAILEKADTTAELEIVRYAA